MMLVETEHETIKDIFYEACQLDIEERDAFLHKKCGNNGGLISEVNSLLRSYKKSTEFFGDLANNILGVDLNDEEIDNELNPDPYNIIGSEVNRYIILSKIADGGMGVVYKAKDNQLDRVVALKFLPPFLVNDHQAIKRFRHEAMTASKMDHPNIGTIYSVEETAKGFPFISMAFYQGQTLQELLNIKKLSNSFILNIIKQIISGLTAAHQNNIVHRDIKPSNIILLKDDRIKIVDFGLAKVCDQQMTKSGIKMGTLSYMSPEHIKGDDLDERSDIWSLGVLFYELLSGQRPFTGLTDQSLMYAVLNDDVDFSLLDVPFSTKKLIGKCLQRNVGQRYQLIEDLSSELNNHSQRLAENSTTKSTKLFENFLLNNKLKIWFGVFALVTLMVLVAGYYSIPKTPTRIANISLPVTKSIAIYSSQESLSDFQLGLINDISQTRMTIAKNNADVWVVPFEKVKKYQAVDYAQARNTFGVNLIINLKLSYINNQHLVEISLIESEQLVIVNKKQVIQSTNNVASLQQSIRTAVLEILNLSNVPKIQKELSALVTTDHIAYEAYLKALGLLQRLDQEGSIQQAISLLKLALDKENEFLLAKSKLADAYWLMYQESKDIDYAKKAEKIYESLLLKKPDDINSYLSLGKLHTVLARYGTALASYKLALEFHQNSLQAFEGMADIYEKTNELKLAEEYYLKPIQLSPDRWDGYNDLGGFYLRRGRYQDAVRLFKQVIALTPNNAWAYSNLGSAYWYLGQTNKTKEYFEKSLVIQEDDTLYKNLGTIYFYENSFIEAAKYYTKASEINTQDHVLWASLAGAHYYAGEDELLVNSAFKKAIALASKKLEILPNDLDINLSLASYYAWVKQPQRSKQYLVTGKESSLLTVQHHFQIAVIYYLLEDTEHALEWLEKALKKGYPKKNILNSPDLAELKAQLNFKKLISKY